MSTQIIPLTTDPNQTMQVMISIDGQNKTFILNLRWNTQAEYWVLTITDASTLEVLLNSVPLVTPGNILEQYTYLAIGSLWLVNNGNVSTDRPDTDDLGTGWVLVWSDTE